MGAPPGRLRIGVAGEPTQPIPVDPACSAALEDAAALLADLGHELEPATPPQPAEALVLFTAIWQTIPGLYPVQDRSLLDPLNAALADRADSVSSIDYVRAVAAIQQHARAFAAFCAGYDVVLTPTLAQPPLPIGWTTEPADPWEQFERAWRFTPFTPPVNLAGLPAASVPLFWADDGLPIGVHLIGRAGEEALLFRLAAQLEQARPWSERRPPAVE